MDKIFGQLTSAPLNETGPAYARPPKMLCATGKKYTVNFDSVKVTKLVTDRIY